MPEARHKGWVLAALGMLLVSTDSFFVRLSHAGGVDMAFLVAAVSLPLYLVLNRRLESSRPLDVIRAAPAAFASVALLGGVSQTAFIVAVTRTDVANVVAIVASAPVMAALVAWAFLSEQTPGRVWAAIGVTVVGVAIVVSGSIGAPRLDGDLTALAAIAAFALSIVVWRRNPDLSRFVGLAGSAGATLLMTAPFADPLSLDARAYMCAAAMGLLFNTAGRIAHSNAPRFAPSSEVALFTPVETVAATMWAWLAFDEIPEATTLVGAAVIVAGVLYGTLAASLRPRAPR